MNVLSEKARRQEWWGGGGFLMVETRAHLFEDPDIVRDRERVPGLLVGEEIVVIIESRPCDPREAWTYHHDVNPS